MAIRSNQLWNRSLGANLLVDCVVTGTGETALVKYVTVYNTHASLTREVGFYISGDDNTVRQIARFTAIPPQSHVHWAPLLVVEPGRKMQAIAPSGGIFTTGHGSLLVSES